MLGDLTLHTATLFDFGVYFVVVGVTMTIIQTIGEDE
jgi:multicomponent Na+:H+ antiporter subunit B